MSRKEADGVLHHREQSETAETAGKRLHGTSGVMRYVVILSAGGAKTSTVVEAATGDEAAEKALQRYPGQKVAYVGPASGTDVVRLADEVSE